MNKNVRGLQDSFMLEIQQKIVEKKNHGFIANLEHVESEEEALAYIETIRKKNIGMQDIIAMHTASEKNRS